MYEKALRTIKRFFQTIPARSFAAPLALAVFFIAVSYLAHGYEEVLREFIGRDSVLGIVGYIVITAAAVVLAPLSTLPLLPVASHLWGVPTSALLSIVGWVIGAQIAFLLARYFGAPLIGKIVPLEGVRRIERRLPARGLFWTVVFLRMIIPVDLLSYALGLFSQMKSTAYFFATLIGVTPFAFVLAYAGILPARLQLLAGLSVISIIVSFYMIRRLFFRR